MKAEVSASGTRHVAVLGADLWRALEGALGRFPQRIRESRFWHIQLLVLVGTAPHYLIEISGHTDPFETLHGLAITLYILPLLYAALSYGWEGALLTALWAGVLTSPSLWIWHRSQLHWITELGQLAITLPVGMLVAWRVDLETKQRLRAEETSASLKLLNEVGESLSHTLEVEQQIPRVLRRLLLGLALDSVWLCLEPESAKDDLLVIEEVSGPRAVRPTSLARDLHRRVAEMRGATHAGGQVLVAPLTAEAGVFGSLGATLSGEQTFTHEQVELLTTVAHQIRVAVENGRLYKQRQESMQSYVRQVTQAQEEERRRIARELHDETAQELVHLVRKLEPIRDAAEPGQAARLDDVLNVARGTLRSVRRYSRDLRPSVLDDLGLVAAIEMVVEEARRRIPSGAQLRVTGKPQRVNSHVELALFRIAQEALRNVEKHASASSATVELHFTADETRLCVTDDGIGFSPPRNVSDLARLGKLGLLGMKERAELVGGALEVRSSAGNGTRLVVSVGRADELSG